MEFYFVRCFNLSFPPTTSILSSDNGTPGLAHRCGRAPSMKSSDCLAQGCMGGTGTSVMLVGSHTLDWFRRGDAYGSARRRGMPRHPFATRSRSVLMVAYQMPEVEDIRTHHATRFGNSLQLCGLSGEGLADAFSLHTVFCAGYLLRLVGQHTSLTFHEKAVAELVPCQLDISYDHCD